VIYQPFRVVGGFSFGRILSRRDDRRAVKNHLIKGLSSFTPFWSCQFLNSLMNSLVVFPVIDAVCILVIASPSLLAGVKDFLRVSLNSFQVPNMAFSAVCCFHHDCFTAQGSKFGLCQCYF